MNFSWITAIIFMKNIAKAVSAQDKETAVYENRMQQYRSVRYLAVRDV